MKLNNIRNIMLAAGLSLAAASCVDDIKFGNAFLEKAPGGTVTIDTVFNNAEYARQFLAGVYSRQYYGLPYSNRTSDPVPCDPYVGKNQYLTDCWQNLFDNAQLNKQYYTGLLTSGYGQRGNTFEYLRSNVWTAVRAAWILIENVDKTPGLTDEEKAQMKAEAKCLIAARYFDTFRFYGGLPIVESSFKFDGSSYNVPRGTVEETVNFMVKLLDEAIPNLQWNYNASDKLNDLGRWTQAGAMALKCKILLFAASPLFNADKPYSTETGLDADANEEDVRNQQLHWWYGGFDQQRWETCRTACKEFFDAVAAHGNDYHLVQAEAVENKGKSLTVNDYRIAFRTAYFRRESPEVLHSTRVFGYDAFKSSQYIWHMWGPGRSARVCFNPTAEYIEMFPWADGKPLSDFDSMTKEQKDSMFTKGVPENGDKNFHYTRDPRLYETAIVPGMYNSLNWESHTNQSASKEPARYELWVGGKSAGNNTIQESGSYGTGFANNKYYLSPNGSDALRQYTHWAYIRLSEMYLTYAEAILQSTSGSVSEALKWINPIRNRVGLKNLEEVNPSATASKEALLEELLKERVRELGMEDTRWFDIIRYKKGSILEKPLHGLRIYRLDDKGNENNKAWYGTKDKYPTNFRYERFQFTKITRMWWSEGFDPKWYLQPFPKAEIEKNYGLIQNPGW